jgi:protein-S-isoprenylcysteine O-methyltransferase Ste14
MDNLPTKSLQGVFGLSFVLGLLIFLPAWRLTYWQGWVYLGLFTGCVLAITLYLLAKDRPLLQRRMNAGARAEPTKPQQLIQAISGLLVVALIVESSFDHRFSWSQVADLVSWGASLGVLAGFYIVWRTFQANSYTSATIQVGAGQVLTTTGPYGLVRHPMYSGALLLFINTPLVLGSFISALLTVVLVTRALDEERLLGAELAGYSAYCSQVNYRLVPLVW